MAKQNEMYWIERQAGWFSALDLYDISQGAFAVSEFKRVMYPMAASGLLENHPQNVHQFRWISEERRDEEEETKNQEEQTPIDKLDKMEKGKGVIVEKEEEEYAITVRQFLIDSFLAKLDEAKEGSTVTFTVSSALVKAFKAESDTKTFKYENS